MSIEDVAPFLGGFLCLKKTTAIEESLDHAVKSMMLLASIPPLPTATHHKYYGFI